MLFRKGESEMKRILLIGVLFTLVFSGTDASADWLKTFGGMGEDDGWWVEQTSDGGFIIVGNTTSYSTGDDWDVWLIKTDANGNQQWNKTFGGPTDDYGMCVQQTWPDGGYIIVGTTGDYFGVGNPDILLIKTDAGGNTQWSKTFGGIGQDRAACVRQTSPDGGYVIAGTTGLPGNDEIWLFKTDSAGNTSWSTTFAGTAESVQQTTDGGYIIGGSSLIKTSSTGTKQWESPLRCADARQTSDGGYILTGGASSNATLVKTYSNGIEEWREIYAYGGSSYGNSVRQTSDGGYVLAGSVDYSNTLLIRTDSLGTLQWDKIVPGTGWMDRGNCVQQTSPDGGYIVAGTTDTYGPGAPPNTNVLLIKVLADSQAPLTQVNLSTPANESILSAAPTFTWTADGGANNRFVVDLHIPGVVALWTTPLLSETSWTMPNPIWNFISPGTQVFWRARGADLDISPLTIITSDEVWSFTKQ